MNEVQTILNRTFVLNISVNNIGKLVGLSSGEISARLNGRKPLTAELYKKLLNLTDALTELKVTSNIPIDWSDVESIQAALKEREEARQLAQQTLEAYL